MGLAAGAPVLHEACLLQNAQMLGHRGLRHAGAFGEGVHGELAVAAQALEDRPAGRVGEAGEHGVRPGGHEEFITYWLWICQTLRTRIEGTRPLWNFCSSLRTGLPKIIITATPEVSSCQKRGSTSCSACQCSAESGPTSSNFCSAYARSCPSRPTSI